MKLFQLKIGHRIGLLCAALVAVMIAVSLYSLYALTTAGARFERLRNENMTKERIAVEWQGLANTGRVRTYAILKSTDAQLGERIAKLTAEGTAAANAASAKLDKLDKTPKEQALYDAVNKARKAYLESRDEVVRLKKVGEPEKASELFTARFEPESAAYLAAIARFVEGLQADVDSLSKEMDAQMTLARTILIAMSALGTIVSILLGFWLARGITRPIGRAVAAAQALAQGDLTRREHTVRADETGQLLAALDDTTVRLGAMVREIRVGSVAISGASQEIAAGNADLSQRTEQQAASLEETASSMEELASTVKQNAENAKQANQLAATASQVAVKGGAVVGEVVQTMSSINESSKKIADIIGVIDGIAFQTNILALNAAVEAARAGEQGRGFAVVASEVRSLAQRSAGAAKEIKELISDSVQKVENGTRLVDDAGSTMEEIVASVKRVTDIMADIAAATHEQSSGIDQVNQAVSLMDQATQQNAALVEEAAAAAESMREQAAALGREVGAFRLDDMAVEAPAAPKPAVTAAPKAERRSAGRATNVTRLGARVERKPAVDAPVKAKTGTDGDWSEF